MKEKVTKNYRSIIIGDKKRSPLSIKANSTSKKQVQKKRSCRGCSRKRKIG